MASVALPEAAYSCTFQLLIEALASWLTMDSRGFELPRLLQRAAISPDLEWETLSSGPQARD